MRLGLAGEGQRGFSAEVAQGVEAVAREWGWSVSTVESARDEEQVDVLLATGDVTLFPDLVARPKAARRVLWHGEILPRPTPESGSRLHELAPTGRLLDIAAAALPAIRRNTTWNRWREQAAIVREPLANIRRLRRHATAFDRIVVDSRDRAQGAITAGLDVDVVPYGYHAAWAGPLQRGSERPVDVLMLAHLVGRAGRRQRWLASIRAELEGRGVNFVHVGDALMGRRRDELLGQVRIVIDVHRQPGNHPGFRFVVATAAGAAVISEPLPYPEPLVPGVHYLETPVEAMAEQVLVLLADEPRRRKVVTAAQELLTTDLAMERCLPRVLGVSPD